jgi:hypothetical protein
MTVTVSPWKSNDPISGGTPEDETMVKDHSVLEGSGLIDWARLVPGQFGGGPAAFHGSPSGVRLYQLLSTGLGKGERTCHHGWHGTHH